MIKLKLFDCLLAIQLFIVPFGQIFAQENDDLAACSEPAPRDGIYLDKSQERPILQQPHLEQRDVMWEKKIWREIDLKELRNQHFAYENRPLASILMNAAFEGKIKAYSNGDDRFSKRISAKDLREILEKTDTFTVTDPLTGLDDITTAKRTFDPHEVVRFRIKEITYFDSKLSRMNTRIIGIAPIKQFYSSNGDLLAHTPICWFYFDEIRPLLASEGSFNSNNDIKSFSWDDVFLSRYFSSFIVKESNVKDARLADMYSGMDALHEGEKIKEGIRNYEGDLFGN